MNWNQTAGKAAVNEVNVCDLFRNLPTHHEANMLKAMHALSVLISFALSSSVGGLGQQLRNGRRIMNGVVNWFACAALCGGILAFIQSSDAQSATSSFRAPALEVVSVKPAKTVDMNPNNWGVTADGLNVNGPLSFLIRSAFGAELFDPKQITGEPSWCAAEDYEIVGKVGSDDVEKLHNLDPQQRTQMGEAMLQAVLADRFKMKSHEDRLDGSIFALVLAKNGPKLKKATPGDKYLNGLKLPSGRTTGAGTMTMSPGRIIAQALSLEDVAKISSGPATGRVVADKTGLTGEYDFTLTWTPEQSAPQTDASSGTSEDVSGPSIFTAIQEQLGLKLQPAKGPVRVLVIDHIERPSEN
jgi:uncharacterized protein (TIGR03435 family)